MSTLGTWRIELFGGLRALRDGQGLRHLGQTNTATLLAFLGYRRGQPQSRDVLIELMWASEGVDQKTGADRLSVELTRLRRYLAEPGDAKDAPVVNEPGFVRLDPNRVATDVHEFEAALRAADAAERAGDKVGAAAALAQAADRYKGPLLLGHDELWTLAERERLSDAFFAATVRLCRHLAGAGERDRAVAHARRAVKMDSLREEAYCALMELQIGEADPYAALRTFGLLERTLRSQLDAAPSAGATSLAAEAKRLLARAPAPRRPAPAPAAAPAPAPAAPRRYQVALLCVAGAAADDLRLARLLGERLAGRGHRVFPGAGAAPGGLGTAETGERIRNADAVVPLLSEASVQSELFEHHVQTAGEAARRGAAAAPRFLPVRVAYTGLLPDSLAGALDPLPYSLWRDARDDDWVAEELIRALEEGTPASSSAPAAPLEPVGGAVPLDSAFYVVRPTDDEFRAAVARRDGIVLVKGARQTGKTSLLARGLDQVRRAGLPCVQTDLQKLNASHLGSIDALFLALADAISDQLDVPPPSDGAWDARRGPNANFERFVRRQVLEKVGAPVVWALDEADRLFPCDFRSEVFGLFRAWHNARALDPGGPWGRLTLVLAYATEARLFITDPNQSPFNVGTPVALQDFGPEQLAELNRRYGAPLRSPDELERFDRLVGGQPYLARRGLDFLVAGHTDVARLEAEAGLDGGPFGDHLRRILALLLRDAELTDAVRAVLRGSPSGGPTVFHRLESAGVLTIGPGGEPRIRCGLYGTYLERHLS